MADVRNKYNTLGPHSLNSEQVIIMLKPTKPNPHSEAYMPLRPRHARAAAHVRVDPAVPRDILIALYTQAPTAKGGASTHAFPRRGLFIFCTNHGTCRMYVGSVSRPPSLYGRCVGYQGGHPATETLSTWHPQDPQSL